MNSKVIPDPCLNEMDNILIPDQSIPVPDQSIRDQALDITQSFIVEAPAGSGKTTLLTERLLTLLAQAVSYPEECLAITFTKKAAAEMRERVQRALESASPLARQILIKDKELSWGLLENPHRLKIQTIDSFCAGLIQQMPLQAEIGFRPEILEDPAPLYEKAVLGLFTAIENEENWSSDLRKIMAHLDNNLDRVYQLFLEMLPCRDQWLPYLGQMQGLGPASQREELEKGLKAVILDRLHTLQNKIPKGFEEIPRLVLNRPDWPSSEYASLQSWLTLSNVLLTEENQFRKTLTKNQGFPTNSEQKKMMIALLNQLAEEESSQEFAKESFKEALINLRQCPSANYEEPHWDIVQSLIRLLPLLAAHLTLVFQETGQVDFTEILLAALRGLGEKEDPSDLALNLDYKIKHILIDEFQDTSISQFRLLEKLTAGWESTDGRTLFLVGDPKQSIYRFRQAEVALFLQAKIKGINEKSLIPLQLKTNFRSTPTLVEWVNTQFKDWFPKEADPVSGSIPFGSSVSFEESEAVVDPKESEAKIVSTNEEEEAAAIVEMIQVQQKNSPNDAIALLVRSRNHLVPILSALRTANITYEGVDLETLQERPLIQDLVSLTRALLNLDDRLAWLSILRSPWFQLSLADLYEIANANEEHLPIWKTLLEADSLSHLSETGKEKIKQGVPVLENTFAQKGRLSFRRWVYETWEALKGPLYLPDEQSLSEAEIFFEILGKQGMECNIDQFEKELERLYAKSNLRKDYEDNEDKKDKKSPKNPLQIMTIHKAKGLEFDTVIVAGLGRRTAVDQDKILLWRECVLEKENRQLILAPIKSLSEDRNSIYSFLLSENKKQAEFESVRLLYVAATRAKKRLFCFTHKESLV